MEQEAICPAGKIIIIYSIQRFTEDRFIRYPPFEWPLEADDEDEDDVGGDPEYAEAGQQEGGHLLVLRAQEPRLPEVRHRYILYSERSNNN